MFWLPWWRLFCYSSLLGLEPLSKLLLIALSFLILFRATSPSLTLTQELRWTIAAINQHAAWTHRKFMHCARHCKKRRPENVGFVDLVNRSFCNRPSGATFELWIGQLLEHLFSLLCRHLFRIGHLIQQRANFSIVMLEYRECRSNNWTCQGSTSCLVSTSHNGVSFCPEL